MKLPKYTLTEPAVVELAHIADDLQVITLESRLSLREFLAAVLSFMPGWMRFLYRVRKYFVMLLGTGQDGIPEKVDIRPQDVSFTPGDPALFFTVTAAREDRFWLAEARDKMISGYIGAVAEPLADGITRFHFITGARYRRFTGRIYYNAILPFHHLVVNRMVKHALKSEGTPHSIREMESDSA